MFSKLFQDWEQQLLRPVLISLLTALVLFLASLLFAPIRNFLFPTEIENYPIYCTAEPYLGPDGKVLLVDFYLVNLANKDYSHDELEALLQSKSHERESRAPSPDVELKYSRMVDGRSVGRVEQVTFDADFNLGKGELDIETREHLVSIKVIRITERALMRVTIRIADIPDLENSGVTRMTKSMVPLDFRRYQDGCYSRS